MKDWAKMPDFFDVYFSTVSVVLQEGEELYISILSYLETMYKRFLLGNSISNYCQRLETCLENKMVKRKFLHSLLLSIKRTDLERRKSKESLNTETRITCSVVITREYEKLVKKTAMKTMNKYVRKKQRLDQVFG